MNQNYAKVNATVFGIISNHFNATNFIGIILNHFNAKNFIGIN